mgnify:CR=1 FL=1
MLKVKLVRDYVSQNGNATFVYEVTGDKESLASYKKIQGKYYREDKDTNAVLWFTTRCIGDDGELIITSKGNVVPNMSEFRKAQSLTEQAGGNFGDALAKASVERLLGGKKPSAPSSEQE